MILKTAAGGHLEADGRAAGGRAVLRLEGCRRLQARPLGILDQHTRFARDIRSSRALLNALPHPAWLRDQDGRLSWVNEAYVKAVDAESEREVVEGPDRAARIAPAQEPSQRVLKTGQPFTERLPLIVGGEQQIARGHRCCRSAMPRPARPSTSPPSKPPTASSTARVAAYDRTLDRVATAVAIFSPEQKLTFFNAAYQKLWQLDADWLDTSARATAPCSTGCASSAVCPRWSTTANGRTRSSRCYKEGTEHEDWWHLPDGRILHVMAAQRPDGGVTYLYADETERLALESRYNALISVQSETLDSLKEGVAVFGTDGRLRLFNSAFAAIWKLSPPAARREPAHRRVHPRRPGALRRRRHLGAEWRNAVTSFSDEREPLEGQMVRPDNSVIDYAVTPLPDGGTLLTFVDVTYLEALRARPRRAQRGARHRRQAQEPVHRPRVV